MHKQTGNKSSASSAWVTLIIVIVGMAATFGMRVSFGAYISKWELEFSAGRTAVTSISTLSFIVFAFGQPLAGKLNDLFGKSVVPSVSLFLVGISLLLTSQAGQIWHVYVLYGVLFSLGFSGCSTVVFSAIITNWFIEKRGFALGLSSAGMAIGQLILVPANQFIMDNLGWRPTLAILSILIMVVVGPLFLIFLRSKPEEKGMKPYGYKECLDGENGDSDMATPAENSLSYMGVFKQSAFWVLTIMFFVCGFTDVGVIQTHLFPIAGGKGISDSVVAIAFSVMAISNIAGTVITGHLADRFIRKRQLAVLYSIRTVSYILLVFIQRPWLIFPYAVIFGSVDMATGAPTTSLIADLFKGYSVGFVLGMISLGHQLGGAAGSWLPGLLYDLTGSYVAVLLIAAALLIAVSLLVLRIHEPKRKTES